MFFYLQQHAFGGRVAAQTFGTATTPPTVNLLRIEENLSAAHLRLAGGTMIENLPWRECAARYDRPHTFIYMDPPYWQTEGYGLPFEFGEYEALAQFIRTCKSRVMLSINDHPDIRRAFTGLPNLGVSVKYATASAHGSLKSSQELVITNWDAGSAGNGLF